MNKRILASVMVIGLVGAVAGSSTMALFNDTEASEDNSFVTGALDLKIDWDESYNGEHIDAQSLTNNPGSIFDFEDIKPGDHGEATVSLHLEDNPGWVWMRSIKTHDSEVKCTEPEAVAEGGKASPDMYLSLDGDLEDEAKSNDASANGEAQYISGKRGQALDLNGDDQYGEVGHISDYNLNQGRISLWVKPSESSLNGHKGIIGKDAGGNEAGHFYVSLRDGKPNFRLQDGSTSYTVQASESLEAGKWQKLTASFGPEGQKLFVDDAIVGEKDHEGGISGNENPFVLGASTWASNKDSATPVEKHFKGGIDEIKLYSHQEKKTGCGTDGELDEEIEFTIWRDDGDNVLQDDEHVIKQGTFSSINFSEGALLGEFPAGETEYIGIKWKLPREVGNKVQKDKIGMDFQFYTEQRRHNDNPENPWTGEPKDPVDDKPEKKEKYYQVDLVGGEPIENLSESTYHSEGRMQRYMHGGPGNAIDNESEPDQVKTGTGGVDCVDSQPFTVDKEEDTATVEFTVLNKTPECGTGTDLSLVSYKKHFPGWIAEKAGEQELFDSVNKRFDPGNHSLTVEIPDVNDGKSEEPKEPEKPESEYKATQGDKEVEITPLSGDNTVEEFYDFRLPDRFDHDNQAQNGASYPGNGPYYQSAGTDNLQQQETSIMFLYEGSDGLSFVVVHDKAGGDGGSATWEISGLDGSGEWVVKDDLYLKSNGQKAGSNYDNWNTSSSTQTIDWTWGSGGTDGGAYKPLSDNFSFTIDPAFNEESALYEQFYNGDIDEWQILSGDMSNPDRTTLDMTEEVTVEAQ